MLDELEVLGFETDISDAAFDGLDILVNASSMGMGESGASSLTLATLGDRKVRPLVFDMVYHPLETGLLNAAKRQGHNRADGLEMLISQARSHSDISSAREPPANCDAELRALLTA